jgi:type I restriction enzyme S subunit
LTTTAVASSWGTVALRDCCDIVAGSTPSREVAQFWDGPIPWATPKDLSDLDSPVLENTPEGITQAGFDSCSTQMLPKGAVLFSSRAPIGLVAIAGRPMCTNQGFKSFVPGSGIDSLYLYYCLKSMVPQIQARGNGATFKEVSKEVIGSFEIPIPFPDDPRRSLAEQKRIAAILDKADAIRRRRQEAARLADTLITSVFYEMFGDPGPNPKRWPTVRLGEIQAAPLCNGAFRKNSDYTGSSHAIVWVKELFDGYVIDTAPSRRFDPTEDEISRYSLELGDILFCRSSLKLEGTGYSNVFDGSDVPALFECHLIRLRPDKSQVDPLCLNFMLRTPSMRRRMVEMARTVTMSTLGQGDIERLELPLPPLDLQARFARRLRQTVKMLRANRAAQPDFDNLFNALVQRAFRGEL